MNITFSKKGGRVLGKLDLISCISEMKMIDYKNMLAMTSLIELLIEKGIIDKQELSEKTKELDSLS